MAVTIKSQVIGSITASLTATTNRSAKAVTDAVRTQTQILKNNWRAQIVGAGLSTRLSNTVRSETFPKTGSSFRAAGEVTVAKGTPQNVLAEVEEGAVITVAGRKYLAIPTENVPRGNRGSKLKPHALEAFTGYHLRFAQNRRGTRMLVADTTTSISKRGGIRPATRGRIKQGRKVTTLVFYNLVPEVTIRKRLNLMGEAQRIGGELAALIAERLK